MESLFENYMAEVNAKVSRDSVQFRETRLAFYAGGRGLLHTIMSSLDDTGNPDEVTEGDLDVVRAISRELDDFLVELESKTRGRH